MDTSLSNPLTSPLRQQLDPYGEPLYTITQQDAAYRIDFEDGPAFLIHPTLSSEDPEAIHVASTGDADPDLIQHLFTNQILPMHKAWRGSLVLHASAVGGPAGCTGFYGPSGAGKSSLATTMAHRFSARLWSDDWLEIQAISDGFSCRQNPFSPRLNHDHYRNLQSAEMVGLDAGRPTPLGNKLEFPSSRHQNTACSALRLLGLFELDPQEPGAPLHLEKLAPSQAFQSVCGHLYRLDTSLDLHMQREFETLTRLTLTVPCYRVTYPHSFQALERLIQAIEPCLAGEVPRLA